MAGVIVIVAIGSRGDVQPYVALARGLMRAGHAVRLATHAAFAPLLAAHGVPLAPLPANPREILEGAAGQAWLDAGANPVRFLRDLERLSLPYRETLPAALAAACAGARLILFSALGWAAASLAEALRTPAFPALLQPSARSFSHPSVLMPPGWPRHRLLNRLGHLVVEQLFWQPFAGWTNRWRRRDLGLPPLPRFGPWAALYRERQPVLYGYSPLIAPPPPDLPPNHHITGAWLLDAPADWTPPPALAAFLAAGPPPVYIGFGSMRVADGSRGALTDSVVRALRRVGVRGVLGAGWARLGEGLIAEDICAVDEAPHEWLFPRTAAIVHHSGAGTTAAALRSGRPSLGVPFFADQPFWADRAARLGVGPAPLPRRELNEATLTERLARLLHNPAHARRAAQVGARLRAESGIDRAVALIERLAPAA